MDPVNQNGAKWTKIASTQLSEFTKLGKIARTKLPKWFKLQNLSCFFSSHNLKLFLSYNLKVFLTHNIKIFSLTQHKVFLSHTT